MLNYRHKIYKHYSSNRIDRLAPETIAGFRPRESYLKKLIKDYFPKDKNIKILEIGCGHGTLQYYIAQAGYVNSIGIDASEEQVKEAHRLGIKNVIFADLAEYINMVEDNSIDLLIAFDVIEHFTKDELSGLVDEFYRIVKKGGRIIIHTPNGESPFSGSIRYGDFTHELAFTRQSIAQLFLSSGFSDVKSNEDKPIIHGLKSLIRYLLWEYLIRKFYWFLVIVETGGCDKEAIFTQNFLTVVRK